MDPTMKKRSKRAGTMIAERISVDYPHEGELIASSCCTFQIDAPQRTVEIAIDGDGWRSCRRRDGCWWYDWPCAEPGRHQALVRCAGAGGAEPAYRTCRFVVGPAAPLGRSE
jgi:hypothetical protein